MFDKREKNSFENEKVESKMTMYENLVEKKSQRERRVQAREEEWKRR